MTDSFFLELFFKVLYTLHKKLDWIQILKTSKILIIHIIHPNFMEEINQSFSLPTAFTCQIKHFPIKRAFDILFSLVVMTVGLPVFFLIALSICLTSKGKIIYSHERVGRGGRPFRCYKFRSMWKDADARLKTVLENNPNLRKEWDETRKLKKDPRITVVGHFLRKTSLDEIPQFWNVLMGDLSVVGPRPVVQAEITKFYGSKASKILSIRPGLTCFWQVSGRNDISYEQRIKMDEEYLEKQSLFLDIKLILKTVLTMIFRKGAY